MHPAARPGCFPGFPSVSISQQASLRRGGHKWQMKDRPRAIENTTQKPTVAVLLQGVAIRLEAGGADAAENTAGDDNTPWPYKCFDHNY